MVMTLGWFGPIYEYAGYGEVARNILLELKKRGVDIHLQPEVWGKPLADLAELRELVRPPPTDTIHIYHKVAPGFHKTGRYNIGFTVWETDTLHPSWVPKCNMMDEIWTPSHFCKEVFKFSGVRVPVKVMPHGVDVKRFNPNVKPVEIENRKGFNFLSVFSGTLERKGFDILLKAFTTEFKKEEDVSLTIKAHLPFQIIKRKIARYATEDNPLILYIGSSLPTSKIPRLYRAADCFVAPSRGEGWDLPCTEAMASGIPVIATKWGGHLEYMNHSNSFLINIEKLVPVNIKHIKWYNEDMRWSEPSLEHLKELMRYVYENPKDAEEKAAKAREDIVKKWRWSRVARKIFRRLKRIERKWKLFT